MAARRLLIVMLILLGLSTLAAALIPQRALRGGGTTRSTTQATTTTTATPAPPSGRALAASILVGGKKVPVIGSPLCAQAKAKCEPLHAGDHLTLTVYSRDPAQLEVPEFGMSGFASRDAPAYFDLLLSAAGSFGMVFPDPGGVAACGRRSGQASPCVAARIEVLTQAAARKVLAGGAKSRARAGSGRS
jgi:hypothetical protein